MESIPGVVRVLVVEDNAGDAELIILALAESTRPQFHVTHATTLAEAREHLRRDPAIDVILLDLSLPDAAGEATVTRMRDAAPNLPIVIMTGFDDPEFAERMVALGAQDYMVKGDSSSPMVARAIRYALTRMQQTLERESLVKDLQSSVEMKNKMFGILAHDLRNPIGAVCGYVEFIEMTDGEKLTERTASSLRTIHDAASYMNNLIEDVLAMAVAEAGEVTMVRQRLDLGTVAKKALAVAAIAADKKQVRLALEAQAAWVEGDAAKIEQVLNNLIGNAIKFSEPGGVVTISAAKGADGACLKVTDHGAGIPAGVMQNLFKPFVKGKTGTAGERSNGLGLYICARIVEAHGGRILVDSQPGQGSVFTVMLPSGR